MDGRRRGKARGSGRGKRRHKAGGSGGAGASGGGLGIPRLFCDDPPPPVASASSPGVKNRLSRCDHAHEGVHRIASADGSVRVSPANGKGDVDLSVAPPPAVALPFRVVSSGSVFVAGNDSPILATFTRQPGERVLPLVWASEKSGVFIIGLQATLAQPGDRTLSFYLEKTSNPEEMNLRCTNGDEDVRVEWTVLGLVV